jgi:hypothetical protein
MKLRLADRLALRPKEAAAVLGLSERAFRSLLPRLPSVRLDGAVLIPVELLRRWLETEARADGDRAARMAEEVLRSIMK